MRILIILLLFTINIHPSFGQNAEYYRVKKNTGKVIITPYLNSDIVILRVSGFFRNARKVIYLDTINGYQVKIPKSLQIQETNSLYNFCNLIPRENGRDNAICINSSPKSDFKSLESFKKHIIEDSEYLIGIKKSWLWGEDSKLISIVREDFNSYDSYKVDIQLKGRKVLGQFIILETNKSFLWLNFVADHETFDSDIDKFAKFLKKFKLLD